MACRFTAVLCLALFLQVWAREPRPCCWIRQMTGKAELLSTTELEDGTAVLEKDNAEFAYDEIFLAKSFIFTKHFENGTQLVGRVVNFHDSGVQYYIEDNHGEETCVRRRISFHFKRSCIAEDASYHGNLTLGDNALTGHVWQQNTVGGEYVANTTYFYAADYCVPISINYVVQNTRLGGYVRSIAYADIKLGICDRDKYFKIPHYCPQDATTSFGQKVMKRLEMLDKPFNMM